MEMFYRILADIVVVLHAGYALFVVLGLAAILLGVVFRWGWTRNFWFRAVHLLMICVVAAEAVVGMACPLTTWENDLRALGGVQPYAGSFLGRLAHDLLMWEFQPWVFRVAHCLFAAAVIGAFWLAPPRLPWRSTAAKNKGCARGAGSRSGIGEAFDGYVART